MIRFDVAHTAGTVSSEVRVSPDIGEIDYTFQGAAQRLDQHHGSGASATTIHPPPVGRAC